MTSPDRPAPAVEPGASATNTVAALRTLGFSHVVAIPDSESARLYDAIAEAPDLALITPSREGEGVAIAAGLWVGGCKPLLLIQNTGVMEAGDAIRGCGVGPRIPLRLLVGWRGYGPATAGRLPIDSAYPYTEPILDAWGIPHWRLMSDDDLPCLAEMDRVAEDTSLPAAVVAGYAFRA